MIYSKKLTSHTDNTDNTVMGAREPKEVTSIPSYNLEITEYVVEVIW